MYLSDSLNLPSTMAGSCFIGFISECTKLTHVNNSGFPGKKNYY
jgi:hypothetical protein